MSQEKFKNKYRIVSTRAQWWDYGNNAAYFITICTANKEHFFGKIINKKIQLSNVGVIAEVFWHEIKKYADFIKLDAFTVMPNHIHGILIIDKPTDIFEFNSNDDYVNNYTNIGNLQQVGSLNSKTFGQKRFQNQGKQTISSIVGGYKSIVTRHAHRLGYSFEWQPRFYDIIIKSETEFHRIAKYINNNPVKWGDDRFYPK